MIHSYLIYDGLRTVLGDDRPLYGLRELEGDELLTIEQRAAMYVREIRSVQSNGPYSLGGWCAAGPLAVESARQLTEAGESVSMVVLFDSWRPGYAAEFANSHASNPELGKRAVLKRKYRYHKMMLAPLSAGAKMKYAYNVTEIKIRSSRDKLYLRHWGMAERILKWFGFPLPHFMHNVSLKTIDSVRQFKGQPFAGKIILIRATDAPYLPQADPACGWNELAKGGVEVLFTPGTHESMFMEPNLSALGKILQQCFEQTSHE
jgi:thioesterase domain-containing protein